MPVVPVVPVVPVLSVVAGGVLVAGVVVVPVLPLVDMSVVVPDVVPVVSVSVLLRVSRPHPAKVSASAVNAARAVSLVELVFIELFVSFSARPPRRGTSATRSNCCAFAQPDRRPPLTPNSNV